MGFLGEEIVVSNAYEKSWGELSKESWSEELEESQDSPQANMLVPLPKGSPPFKVAPICHQTPLPSLTVQRPQTKHPSEAFISQAVEGSFGGRWGWTGFFLG